MPNLFNINLGLSGNALKIIGAVTMLIDHIGVILFPEVIFLRIIGRISFPIFAFMIAEGCEHTKNKLKYFLSVFILGAVCQLALYIARGPQKQNVLISFSIAIIAIFALQYMKSTLFSAQKSLIKKCFAACLFALTLVGIYVLNRLITIDYGFWGCMTPLSVSLFKAPKTKNVAFLKMADNRFLHLLLLSVCLILLGLKYAWVQMYGLFALVFLLFYSGKRGRLKMKYFFYIFYPLHLVILEGISYLF